MPDKDKIESLLKLADFAWRDYSERRAIEWKTNFALWLALGAFADFMFEQQGDHRAADLVRQLRAGHPPAHSLTFRPLTERRQFGQLIPRLTPLLFKGVCDRLLHGHDATFKASLAV